MSHLMTNEGYRMVPSTGGLIDDHGWDTINPVINGFIFHGKRCLGYGFWDIFTGEEMIYKAHGRSHWRLKLPWAT